MSDASPTGSGSSATDNATREALHRYRRAKGRRDQWRDLWQDAMDYALPNRQGFHDDDDASRGDTRASRIFDETAVTGVPRFASRLQVGFFPPDGRAFRLEPGPRLPESERTQETQSQLDQITDMIHMALRQSNFVAEVHEAFQDLTIGTGNLLVEPGEFPGDLVFQSVPLTQVSLIEGPGDFPEAWFRSRPLRVKDLKHMWPGAKLSQELERDVQDNPERKITVVEATERDFSNRQTEAYTFRVIVEEFSETILKSDVRGDGSLPWVTFRWSKAANEVYGRGPLLMALPAIKTTNLVMELILQNAEMAIGGLWTYDDDGVFNPDQVSIEPGTFLPKAQGSEVAPLQSAAQFDVGQIILEEQRRNIRKALFVDELETTGKTPLSATEVAERTADTARDMGAIAGRLQSEFMIRLVRRIVHIFRQQGMIDLPNVDGREITVTPTSPLLRAQNMQDVSDYLRFQQALQGSFGQAGLAMVRQTDAARWLAQKFGIPAHLLRSEDEVQQVIQQAAQQAQDEGGGLSRQSAGDVPIANANATPG